MQLFYFPVDKPDLTEHWVRYRDRAGWKPKIRVYQEDEMGTFRDNDE